MPPARWSAAPGHPADEGEAQATQGYPSLACTQPSDVLPMASLLLSAPRQLSTAALRVCCSSLTAAANPATSHPRFGDTPGFVPNCLSRHLGFLQSLRQSKLGSSIEVRAGLPALASFLSSPPTSGSPSVPRRRTISRPFSWFFVLSLPSEPSRIKNARARPGKPTKPRVALRFLSMLPCYATFCKLSLVAAA